MNNTQSSSNDYKVTFWQLKGESDWTSVVLECVVATPCTPASTPCVRRTQPSARTKRVTTGQVRTLSSQSRSRQTGEVPPQRGEDSLVYSANPNYSIIPTNRAHSPTDCSHNLLHTITNYISYDILVCVNRGTPSEHFSVLSEGGSVHGNILKENKIQLWQKLLSTVLFIMSYISVCQPHTQPPEAERPLFITCGWQRIQQIADASYGGEKGQTKTNWSRVGVDRRLWIFRLIARMRSLCVPPVLTFTNSKFCPHSVFRCFVCISGQTAIIKYITYIK